MASILMKRGPSIGWRFSRYIPRARSIPAYSTSAYHTSRLSVRGSLVRARGRSPQWTHRLQSTSNEGTTSKIYAYEDVRKVSFPGSTDGAYRAQVKSLSATPSKDRILIDVREPGEFEAGSIPSAVNLPIASQSDALFLSPEEFEERFGFEKPAPEAEMVFYCKAGVRSKAAAVLARQSGFERVGEYPGSWMDWEKNEKAQR